MSKIAIYHMTRNAFVQGSDGLGRDIKHADKQISVRDAVLAGIAENKYVYCARVKVDADSIMGALERAWTATQNIDECWTENESVIYSAGREQRSSMIGDIFVHDCRAYMVTPVGFREIDNSILIANELAEKCATGVS